MNGTLSVKASGLAAAAILGFLLSAAVASYLTQPVIAFVQPRPGNRTAPADISVQLRVPRHADNRRIEVSWDAEPCQDVFGCEDHNLCEAGLFLIQVDGEQASTILPKGERVVRIYARCPYLFVAQLIGVGGAVRGRATVRVWVR